MRKWKVEGGTHLGFAGCYGEKTFKAETFEELLKKIRKDQKIEETCIFDCYKSSSHLTFCFTDESSRTIFEFRILDIKEK